MRRTHVPHTHTEANAHARVSTRVRLRVAVTAKRCKLVSDKVRFYLGTLTFLRVERGWESGAGMNGARRWTREMGDGNAWAIFRLAMHHHDYISRLIRSLCGPTITPPHHHRIPSVSLLIKDQEVPSLFPDLRGDINVEWNKLRDSEFMCRDLMLKRWNFYVMREKRNRWQTSFKNALLFISDQCFNRIYFTLNERRYFLSIFFLNMYKIFTTEK